MNFITFKQAVAKQFERLQAHDMFRTNVDKDALYAHYLASFPEGTNPIFRERTDHDCGCCKQFIRAVGNAVAIINGKVETIWDIKVPSEPAYQVVADALANFVRTVPDNKAAIAEPFLHYERFAGTEKNFEQLTEGVKTWNHFFVNINPKFVIKKADIASRIGEQRALHDVLLRSLKEITPDAIDTVLELIANRSLYRGEEHKFVVDAFSKLKDKFDKLRLDDDRDMFAWTNSKTAAVSVSKIKNTSIGTLLSDLSEGKELDHAVRAFEAMVAPANYKRPTALVTKAMIEKAKQDIAELGLTSALQRRFAVLHDITINNILFANREAKKAINGDVFDELTAKTSSNIRNLDKIEEITIERFIAEILPKAKSIEALVENRHENNLVSLIAPEDPTASNMFKWDNKFSWSYNGDMADSIKERVKAAGGNVTGDLCCRLAWDCKDDLDFHMREPGGDHIYFGVRRKKSLNGGMLDLDANGADGTREDPAENIVYENRTKMRDGVYLLSVNQYSRRTSDDKGFTVEIEFDGQRHSISYNKVLRSGDTVEVAKIKVTKGQFEIIESLPSSQSAKTFWNLPTQTFHKVNVLMMSPNFWDDKSVGNKHYMFMLDGCANESAARGFFNEFLKADLDKHRKVLEMVGNKLKTTTAEEQLSGLGFSSTQRNSLVVRVEGSFTRTIKIVF